MMTPSAARAEGVTAQSAAAAFDEICVRQAPGFRRSRTVMARHGFAAREDGSVVRHSSGRLSVTLDWRRTGKGAECRVSYQAADVEGAVAAIEAIARRLFEDAWDRRQVTADAGRTGTAWTVSIQGVLGEMTHVPYSGPGTQGIMILRF